MIRWPGVIKPGTIVNDIFSQEDWLPTLLAAAGEPDIVEKLKKKQVDIERESHDSGIVSPERNRIVEEHFREHPEGDPAVRRVRPDSGTIPVEEIHDDGTMTVREKNPDSEKREQEKKRAS